MIYFSCSVSSLKPETHEQKAFSGICQRSWKVWTFWSVWPGKTIWQIALVTKPWRRKRCTEVLKRPVKHVNVLKPHTRKFLSFSIHEKKNKIICIRWKRTLCLTQNSILLFLFLLPNQKPIVHTALVTNLTRIRGGILLILPNCVELYPNKPLPASPKAAQVYSSEILQYLEMHCQRETLPTSGIIKKKRLDANIIVHSPSGANFQEI